MNKDQIDAAFEYKEVSEGKFPAIERINSFAHQLALVILDECPSCADRTAALRKLRESVMTATEAIKSDGLI